jgi:hypothetical protein
MAGSNARLPPVPTGLSTAPRRRGVKSFDTFMSKTGAEAMIDHKGPMRRWPHPRPIAAHGAPSKGAPAFFPKLRNCSRTPAAIHDYGLHGEAATTPFFPSSCPKYPAGGAGGASETSR